MFATMRPLHRRIFIALLAAIAMLVMLVFGIPLIPAAAYLKYEPSGAVVLLCGLLLGPSSALQCALLKSALYFIIHGGSLYGIFSDLLATVAFAVPVALLAQKFVRFPWRRIPACIVGSLIATAVMIPANYIILHFQFQMSVSAVTTALIYIIPFNLLKAACNSAAVLLLFPAISRAIHTTTNYNNKDNKENLES